MPYTALSIGATPVTGTGERRLFWEGVLNIEKIIQDELTDPTPNLQFPPPNIRRIYRGRFRRIPEIYPALSISWKQMLPPMDREAGSKNASVVYPCIYLLTYAYASVDTDVTEEEVVTNFWRLVDLFEYRWDLHGFCPRRPSSVEGAILDDTLMVAIDEQRADYVIGGSIALKVPIVTQRSYYDGGQTPRYLKAPSGPLR